MFLDILLSKAEFGIGYNLLVSRHWYISDWDPAK